MNGTTLVSRAAAECVLSVAFKDVGKTPDNEELNTTFENDRPLAVVNDLAGDGDRAARLDQYYTHPSVAEYLYERFQQFCKPSYHLMVEPSAGTGSFFKLLPPGSLAYDIDPKFGGIHAADFLKVKLPGGRNIAVIGNPPFGKNSSMAIKFFNHAASQAELIAFILPRTFRKASVENKLNSNFHLLQEEIVPQFAFLFKGKPYNVPAVFQIWERRDEPRALRPSKTKHRDFTFTKPENADFAVQRVGAFAGRVHHDFQRSPRAHYFIKSNNADVEAIFRGLDLIRVAANTAGNPSIAKAEIILLYGERTGR